MPRTSQAEAKAYAKAHYQANKQAYNPARKRFKEAKELAPVVARRVLDLSEKRFIYPDELPRMFVETLEVDELEDVVYAQGWLPNEAKTHGLFLRRAPFAYHRHPIQKIFLRQLSLIPKSKRGVRAELLILNLVLKDL